MSRPALIVGAYDDGRVLAVGVGDADDAEPVGCVVESDPAYPAGAGGECSFPAVFVSLSHRPVAAGDDPYEEVVLVVTPVVDGERGNPVSLTLRLRPEADRSDPLRLVNETYEFAFHIQEGISRVAPRGENFAVRLEWTGYAIVLGATVEYEVETEGFQSQ